MQEEKHRKSSRLLDYWARLSYRVILLFLTAMLVSYSPMFLRGFFNDHLYGQYDYHSGLVDSDYSWGYRHYLYFWMCIVLFFIQAVRIAAWVGKNSKKFEP